MKQTVQTIETRGELINEMPDQAIDSRRQPDYRSLIAIAVENNYDVDKLEKLFELQGQQEAKIALRDFNAALAGFQSECPILPRSKQSDKHSYAPLEVIVPLIRPLLRRWGLSYRFDTAFSDKDVTSTCFISHIGGHTQSSTFTVPVEHPLSNQGKPMMNGGQSVASANSYANRYNLKNALGLVEGGEDNDGESIGVQFITEKQAASIRDKLAAIDGDEDAFCVWLKIESLEAMPARLHNKALHGISEKTKAVKK